jgi:hypothetical protein
MNNAVISFSSPQRAGARYLRVTPERTALEQELKRQASTSSISPRTSAAGRFAPDDREVAMPCDHGHAWRESTKSGRPSPVGIEAAAVARDNGDPVLA